ncbi:hypothetical protein WV31_08365 [Magnetospirillum sp. ME-1]|uniref:hypothetical protein n=1 Tax=Magnetospirillum sp. ME-1 TaxID=1639348 RepID=UPI000A179B29|nr:hypothetical protein [Magnetospirillum sp. ME-1]ARJ65017.1 hypothetical protein WV31_04720 [Magnetospirillum sp. ME-1]ARJ65667.1 hypothetical protein WV31_08365 [Magnetospirillum sp. ME-1]
MDVILISPRGHGGRLRECLDWLQRLPNRRLRVVDDYVDGEGQHRCHVTLNDRTTGTEVSHGAD